MRSSQSMLPFYQFWRCRHGAYRGDGAETGLIGAARRRGLRAVDGLDVLVGQGARSFRIFTGVEAPLDVMRAAVRDVPPETN